MLAGLARDGGLYVPEHWPAMTRDQVAGLAGLSYEAVAIQVIKAFSGDEIPDRDLERIIAEAYGQFSHRLVVPLVQVDPTNWVAELFHGPTLAFKDVAMQVLARLMDRTLANRGEHANIIVATSGDTGGAAIEAFRGRRAIDVFVLYPHGRVSEVQRRQMTTPTEPNVHAIAVEGTFDDCQNLVKALFNDHNFRDRIALAGVNSINWARIVAQVVYYFTTSVALGAPDRRISYSVPTGNFGDIFAGYVAKRMGLPLGRLVIATNANDILVRACTSGSYEPKEVVATSSPSMDIQISSNFERLLFEVTGRDADRVRELMAGVSAGTGFKLSEGERAAILEDFSAQSISEDQVIGTIATMHARAGGLILDPHSAVGMAAALRESHGRETFVTLATAHPAKFPDAISRAIGCPPMEPEQITRQRNQAERLTVLTNNQTAVARYIEARARGVEKRKG